LELAAGGNRRFVKETEPAHARVVNLVRERPPEFSDRDTIVMAGRAFRCGILQSDGETRIEACVSGQINADDGHIGTGLDPVRGFDLEGRLQLNMLHEKTIEMRETAQQD